MTEEGYTLGQRMRAEETREGMLVGNGAPGLTAADGTPYWDFTNGDLYVNDSGSGTFGASWQHIGGGGAAVPHQLLDRPWHTDTDTNAPLQGAIIVGDATPEWARLAHPGAASRVLQSSAAGVAWSANDLVLTADLTNNGGAANQAAYWSALNTLSGENQLALARGGTGADLSATGGANEFVQQAGVGAALTVGPIAAASLPVHTHAGAGQGGPLVVGTTDTGAVAGSVLFAGAAGVQQEDNANLFWDDANNTLGIRDNAPHGNADGLYVPWIAGDTQRTAYFGSLNPAMNVRAILAESSTSIGLSGTTSTGWGVQGVAAAGVGVLGFAITGTAMIANLTGVGAAILDIQDNNVSVWTFEDGGSLLGAAGSTITLADDAWIGLAGPGGRFIFDSTPAPDQIQIADADLYFNTGLGVIHADGVVAGQYLRADGTRYIPASIAGTDLPWTGAANENAYWSGANTLTSDAGWTYNGNDLVVLNESQNSDTAIRVSNANAGAAAFSQVLVKNAAGVGGADGLTFACLGTGYTTAGLTIQDGALIAAGSALTGGLVIRTDAITDMILGTNNAERMRIVGAGNVLMSTTLDLNGIADALILDAAGTTTISAPVNAQIDIEIAGADDFTFTANSFNVLAGSNIGMADGSAIGITGNELLTFNAAGTIAASGITGVTVEDEDWIGLGAAKGRIEYHDEATDVVAVMDANLVIGSIPGDAGISAPQANLDVFASNNGDITAAIFRNSDDTPGTLHTVSTEFKLRRTGAATDYFFTAGKVTVGKEQNWTTSAGTVDSFMAFFTLQNETVNERMRINSAGNVGIGDTSPGYKLDVNGDINTTGVYRVDDTQVVTNRRTGWGAPTGTATRTAFATGSVTLSQLAERVHALIDDLTTHGLIGA